MAVVASNPPPPDPSPYTQPHHFSLVANPRAPRTTEARRRRIAAEEVERCNAHIVARLASLKREPPARFHAPDGTKSLLPVDKRGPRGPRSRDRVKPEWDDGTARPMLSTSNHLGPTKVSDALREKIAHANAKKPIDEARRSWPVKLSVVQHPTPSELHEAGLVNKNLQRRMLGQYKSNRHSELVKLGLGEPVDAVAMWAKRLAIYDPQSEHGASNAGKQKRSSDAKKKNGTRDVEKKHSTGNVHAKDGKCKITGVPKTLGVGRCSATGLLTFFAADGHALKEHPDVPNLFYTEKWYHEFSKMDALMQRQVISWHQSRRKINQCDPGFGGVSRSKLGTEWRPARPSRESWVVNAHAGLALRLMRKMAKGADDTLTVEVLKQRVENCKCREAIEDVTTKENQREIDDGARFERYAAAASGGKREGEKPRVRVPDPVGIHGVAALLRGEFAQGEMEVTKTKNSTLRGKASGAVV